MGTGKPEAERQRKYQQRVEPKGGGKVPVNQLMQGPERAAAWAQQASRFVKKTSWVKAGITGVKEKQNRR